MVNDPSKDKDWEPSEQERTWYRHALTADRGYLCRRNGREMIRFDRPNDPHALEPYDAGKWNIDREHRPLQVLQTTLVAYAADQALCRALGLHEKQREWISMSEKMRIAWIKHGPKKPAIRGELYAAVRGILKDLEG